MMQKTEAINNGCSEKKTDNEKDKEAYESWKFSDLAYEDKTFFDSDGWIEEMEGITGSKETGDKYKGDKYKGDKYELLEKFISPSLVQTRMRITF